MNVFCKTSLHLQDTKSIHKAWKSKVHNFIQSPLPWRRINRHKTNETSPQRNSLEALLSQKSGKITFRDFLKSEFCEENLDFWLACEDFKTFDGLQELKQGAASIYEEFVCADAPRQVNLDFQTREIIRQSLHQPSPSCFVIAQRKIYSLMENDAFPRFIQSEQHRVLLSADSQHRCREKLQKAWRTKSTGDQRQHDLNSVSLQHDLYLLHNY
ncbi:regulator of G-protein signaling 21-like [Cheilinus undulatus]|uniref:regulator of G-protein signaling 21-like n=1 Tax=Cheilinus undulatus TaxID=241271 RepID=UPI001BD4C875|nr:regulator of G-protein signaling 21-like [Cheilinus undulatus]